MARANNSKKCNLKSCGNNVNLKNYPNGYCYLHQNIPSRILMIKDMPLSEYQSLVRKFSPSGSFSFSSEMVRDLSTNSRFPSTTAKMIVDDYFSRGDLSVPAIAERISDRDLEDTVSKMNRSKEWKEAELAVVRGGKTAGANGVMTESSDRVVIYGVSNDTSSYGRFVIDPRISTAGHVDNTSKPIDNSYQSGVTPFGDGVYIDRVYRYCGNSSMWFDRIETMDGSELYKNTPNDAFQNREFEERAREMLKRHPMPTSPIVYDRVVGEGKSRRTVDKFIAMSAASKAYTEESDYYRKDLSEEDDG